MLRIFENWPELVIYPVSIVVIIGSLWIASLFFKPEVPIKLGGGSSSFVSTTTKTDATGRAAQLITLSESRGLSEEESLEILKLVEEKLRMDNTTTIPNCFDRTEIKPPPQCIFNYLLK